MKKRDLEDISALVNVLKDMRKAGDNIGNFLQNDSTLKVTKAIEMLEEISVRAEENEDIELLKMIFYKILPEIDKIGSLYQNISRLYAEMNWEKLNGDLLNRQYLLESLRPNNYVHIAADTTGNAGDYILVRSLKRLVETGRKEDMHWSTINVRASITEDYVETCNKSRGVIIGGGGFFFGIQLQMIFPAGSGLVR